MLWMEYLFQEGLCHLRKCEKYINIHLKRLDVHLMVEDASKLITKYANLNAEYITIHVESENVEQNLKLIKKICH